ncbi:MAG: hypothetical protein EOM30_07900 [Clostridia bacterium]|nr:hypothetical protein [Clostridia bacterium]NLS84668.1 hypothetical protein [Oscillospiraceae bacterium]
MEKVKKIALTILSRIFSSARILIALSILATLPLLMMFYNYSVDCAGYFQGDLTLRETANYILAGEDIIGYDNLNEQQRTIMEILANNFNPTPNWIALGSSRIMQLNRDILQYDNFFNCAVTGGDAADVLGIYYLFDREDKNPEKVIIGFDPWLLRDDAEAFDRRSNKALYTEFLNTKLGYNIEYEKEDTSAKWDALYSLNYFQDNIDYELHDSKKLTKPEVVKGDIYNLESEVKRADGSILYTVSYRNKSLEERAGLALGTGETLLHMTEYDHVGTYMQGVFDKFFTYAKERGSEIIIVLSPFHPVTYDYVLEHSEDYGGFLETENAIRKLAAKHDIKVFGSYNPHNIEGVTEEYFYDGLHCTGDCLEKIIWGSPAETDVYNTVDIGTEEDSETENK